MTKTNRDALKRMVEKFQCPGCVVGSDTTCGAFEPDTSYGNTCKGHVVGTTIMGVGHIALGLPKGFNRTMRNGSNTGTENQMEIRLWAKGTAPVWDKFNVAVWAMEHKGHLFVRTVAPRIGRIGIDVIEGGTLALTPHAINVGEFINDID